MQPLFFLSLLLVAVLVTFCNIQRAIELSQSSEHGTEGHHVDLNVMAQSQQPLLSPSTSKKDFVVRDVQLDPSTSSSIRHEVSDSNEAPVHLRLELSSLLQEIPNNNNTVVSIISMGRLVETYLLERCIRSLRVGGAFAGYIMVFTDKIGFQAYHDSTAWDPKTKLILGWREDMSPTKNATEGIKSLQDGHKASHMPIEYAQKTMIFKRFKTHHAKYIAADPDLASSNIRYVLYVDVDIVVTNPLSAFFSDYGALASREYGQWTSNLMARHSPTDFGFFSLFVDRHLKGKMHTGVILSDLMFHDKCVTAWRKEMDEFYHKSDQVMLLNVIGNYSAYQCRIFELPARHFNFANKRIMQERNRSSLPTFVHITEFRVRRIRDSELYQAFLRFCLSLEEGEDVTGGISWEQAIAPHAKRPKMKFQY
ncbi:hypothetical protein IV203_036021 [Nitzschia inconspicua]|uniref:Nucleotide-diphospho-sugar transferase domain-containing protein n=1 Tax=Nitzschia inconspicua TaxID=303405 RepID=A0A9K3LF28_9STRA|nr:hypothetical protein IV203_036021 [Nitzschia inconspicua]